MKAQIEHFILHNTPPRATELIVNLIRQKYEEPLSMLVDDWIFRREQTGIDAPDSPEIENVKELLIEMRGKD